MCQKAPDKQARLALVQKLRDLANVLDASQLCPEESADAAASSSPLRALVNSCTCPEWPSRTPVAAGVEIRGGRVVRRCECPRRNGLQDWCPLSGCRGRKECFAKPFPDCYSAQYLRRRSRSG